MKPTYSGLFIRPSILKHNILLSSNSLKLVEVFNSLVLSRYLLLASIFPLCLRVYGRRQLPAHSPRFPER